MRAIDGSWAAEYPRLSGCIGYETRNLDSHENSGDPGSSPGPDESWV